MAASGKTYEQQERSTVHRNAKRAHYDKAVIHRILDTCLICHASFSVMDEELGGQVPVSIPMTFGRKNDVIYLHGSTEARILKTIGAKRGEDAVPVCLSFALVDGLVCGRSVRRHSLNYRSCVVFGRAELVEDEKEKLDAMEAAVEHLAKGQWNAGLRHPSKAELSATKVVKVTIVNASAKIRTGGPNDTTADLALPVWAGVIPISRVFGKPVDDKAHPPPCDPPTHLSNYKR